MHNRTCAAPECGKTFTTSRSTKLYCDWRCKKQQALAVKRAKNRAAMPNHCLHCGGPIPTRLRANAIYCGTTCADKAWVKTTTERRRARSTTPDTIQCVRCMSTIEWKPRRKYCTGCADEALREAKYRARVKYKHRLRDLAIEPFERIDIFERDNWTCSICREPIQPDLQYPDPMSPSIDHIVPVAHGGAHSRENVAAAHLVCNVRKGDRLIEPVPTHRGSTSRRSINAAPSGR